MGDRFLAAGFRYFDTAYGYLDGKSEEAVKPALVDRYPRESFYLATKLPAWAGAKDADEAKAMLETSLRRTGAGYFDFYLLHNCGGERIKVFDDFGMWDFIPPKKEEGVASARRLLVPRQGRRPRRAAERSIRRWSSSSSRSTMRTGRAPSCISPECYEVARAHGKARRHHGAGQGGNLSKLPGERRRHPAGGGPDGLAVLLGDPLRGYASLDGLITPCCPACPRCEQMEDNHEDDVGTSGRSATGSGRRSRATAARSARAPADPPARAASTA
jgi:hypothetical protein